MSTLHIGLKQQLMTFIVKRLISVRYLILQSRYNIMDFVCQSPLHHYCMALAGACIIVKPGLWARCSTDIGLDCSDETTCMPFLVHAV